MTSFDPSLHGNGIVHIGPGAFHRAHQAVYTQDAMVAAGGAWRIVGISPRSTDVADTLTAQAGAYTLVTRGADGTRYRRIEALSSALAAARNQQAAIDALATPHTRIVSLTVTEKAYRPDAGIMQLLIKALAMRHAAGLRPLTLMSCDNLTNNGAVLRKVVLEAAHADARLADWIADGCAFPSSMVDRITPATTPALLAEVAAQTGWADRAPVETEAFSQWVIEDDFADGRPAWDAVGATLTNNVAPYERMKLRMLNGAHSMLAYAGHVAGLAHVRDVMAEPRLEAQVARHMTAAAHTLPSGDGLDTDSYREALLDRFRNPHIAHQTYQIAMDGSQKMPQRIFAAASDAHDDDLNAFALATALWARYLYARTEAGVAYALRDPREAELTTLPDAPEARIDALFALPDLVPEALAKRTGFREATATALQSILDIGVLQTLEEAATPGG